MRWWALRMAAVAGPVAVLAAASPVVTGVMNPYHFQVLLLCGIYITLAVSLNLINGITGQFSIGHAGFYAIGAYTGAAWVMLWLPRVAGRVAFLQTGTLAGDAANVVVAIVLGGLTAAVAGFVVGLPSLRLRGDYLAIVTLGFGEVIRVGILNVPALGGAIGMNGIPTLALAHGFGLFWVFILVVVAVAVSRNLMQSVRGLTWLAVREDEVAADAMGVDTTRVKVTAFVMGSALAGAAGAVFALANNGLTPDVFGMDTSIIITTMVVLGGSGSVTGSILAAVVLTALPEALRDYVKDYRMTIFSALLVVLMLTRPQGIFGRGEVGWRSFRRSRGPSGRGTQQERAV